MITLKEADDNYKTLWALNDKYPNFVGHVKFDGKSLPYHDMEACKNHFREVTKNTVDQVLESLKYMIEIAEEDSDDVARDALLKKRKAIRALKDVDVSHCQTIDDLVGSIPESIKVFWGKK